LDEDLACDTSSEEDFVPTSSIANNRFSKPSNTSFKVPEPPFAARKRVRANSTTGLERHSSASTWKQDHRLPQSSPLLNRTQSFQEHTLHNPMEDSPMFDAHSDDEDHDMPAFGHEPSSSILSSSPPRTPPPTKRFLNPNKNSGADLLLYLANSPSRSPAMALHRSMSDPAKEPPSTPPSQHSHLPSSVMNTPGTHLGLFNGALHTPGQNFNLADFCNVTPSPAPAQWRTPNVAQTPNRFSKRGLNFDNLQPPSGSPSMQKNTPASKGLALQLGDELIPRA
jgi:hypothetical protein